MKRFVLTPLAAAVLSATAVASEDATKTFTLDKVTVAATLNEQKISDVANTVSVIDTEEIERTGSTDVRQMLRYEPGIDVAAQGRFGLSSINIRGADRNQVKIVIDGIDQAKTMDNSANYFQASSRLFVDMDSLKQVEVVKGPASSLYGSNAIGGVVAFTTKDPADYLSEEGNDSAVALKTGYTSANDGKYGTLTLANRTGNLESMVIYTRRKTDETENYDDDLVDGTGSSRTEQDPAEHKTENLLVKLQYQLNDEHRIGLTIEDFDNKADENLLSRYSTIYDQSKADNANERFRVSVDHTWDAQLTAFDRLEWSLASQKTKTNHITSEFVDIPWYLGVHFGLSIPTFTTYSDYRVKDYSYEENHLQLSTYFSKSVNNHEITYGFNYEETDTESETNTYYKDHPSDSEQTRYAPVVEAKTYGAFLQDQITLFNGDLVLTPAIRYDNFDANTKSDEQFTADIDGHESDKISVRLGAVYDFTENLTGFAQYAQGFKTPDIQDMYHERNGGDYLNLANPDLEAEESDSYEIGLRYKNNIGNIEITAFYNDYKDYIGENSLGTVHYGVTYANGVTQPVNISEATIKGVELRGALWLDEALGAPSGTSLRVAIAYAEGEGKDEGDTEKTPLETIAPLKGVIGLNYDSPNNSWGGSLDWTLVDDKETKDLVDETDFAPHGYGLVDLSAYYNVTDSLILRATINNLTDKKYWLYEDIRGLSDSTSYLDRYTQPGRNFNVSATYNF